MQIDTSSYARPGNGAPASPLDMVHKIASTQNLINQNSQFQQQFAARRALGPILQQSVDPQTGQLDYNKAFIGMAGNPDTAWLASDFLNAAVQRQYTQQQIATSMLDQEIKRNTVIGTVAGSLLAQGRSPIPGPNGQPSGFTTNVTPEQFMARMTDPDIARIVSPKDAALITAKFTAMSPQERYQFLAQRALQAMTAKESMEKVLGSIHNQQLGGVVQPVQQSALTGTSTPTGPAMSVQPTIAERMTPIAGKDPQTGAETTSPAYQVPGAVPPALGSAVPATAPQTPGGQQPPAGPTTAQSANGGAVTGTPAPSPQVPTGTGARVTGLGPIRETGLRKFAEVYIPDLNKRVQDSNQLLALMSQVKSELKDFKPGSGAALRGQFAALAQSMGAPQEIVDKVANGDLGSLQAAQKLFIGIGTTLAGQLIKAGGGRMTQAEWAKFLSEGAPSTTMDPRGLQKVLNAMTELAHYTRMEQQTYSKYAKQGGDPLDWQNTWSEILGGVLAKREGKH